MGRNLYILAAAIGVLAIVAFVLSFLNLGQQVRSSGDIALWRTTSIVLLLIAMVVALGGILSSLFEQAERRASIQKAAERADRRSRRQ